MTQPLTRQRLETATVIDPQEVSEALECSKRHVYKMIQNGEIPVIRVGSRFKIPAATVRRMLAIDADPIPKK